MLSTLSRSSALTCDVGAVAPLVVALLGEGVDHAAGAQDQVRLLGRRLPAVDQIDLLVAEQLDLLLEGRVEGAELAGALALGGVVGDLARLLAGHVGDVVDLDPAVVAQELSDLGHREQPAAVERDPALGLVALEHHRPADLVQPLGVGADRRREVAEAVGVADHRHAILLASAWSRSVRFQASGVRSHKVSSGWSSITSA